MCLNIKTIKTDTKDNNLKLKDNSNMSSSSHIKSQSKKREFLFLNEISSQILSIKNRQQEIYRIYR